MRQKYERAKELAAQKLLPATELETAKANFDGAVAQVKASEAAESQALANVNQAKLDLSHTIIDTPIDGVVISRNVDVGQTVAASFQAPVLFVIANDLARMRVNAAVDEADVGRVREGQQVVFHVDAFPEREFQGTVEQVRLNPTTVSNVVSYNTIVAVDNRELLLRPGMTATVSIVVRKAENALRIPAAALRFRPEGYKRPSGRAGTAETAAAGPGAAAGGGRQGQGGQRAPGGGPGAVRPAGARPGGGGWPGAAMAADRGGPGGPAVGRGPGRPTTVFVPDEKGQPQAAEVRIGVSDGQFVELREGLEEGALVITGTEIPGARAAGAGPRPGTSPSSNPFQPQRPQPRQR
jgi:HlyD family secretion protein